MAKLYGWKETMFSVLIFGEYISNLNYTKFSLKAIKIGPSYQSHDGVHLKILPRLLEMFLRHLSYYHMKAFYEGYDKINEFSNFKCNLVSRFNKLRGTE